MSMEFHEQVVVITGASGSIGRPLVDAFLSHGARVVAGYHTNQALAQSLEQSWDTAQLKLVQADLRDNAAAKQLISTALQHWSRLDILVTAHSTIDNAPLEAMSLEQWNSVLDTVLNGTMRVCRAALRPMQRARYGRIITISGYQPLAGALTQANYAAALGGIIGFGKSLAREVAPWGITVNSVAPGLIERPQLAAFDPIYIPWATNIVPLKRIGQPNELVPAVLMLANRQASYVSGQTIAVDGGWRMT